MGQNSTRTPRDPSPLMEAGVRGGHPWRRWVIVLLLGIVLWGTGGRTRAWDWQPPSLDARHWALPGEAAPASRLWARREEGRGGRYLKGPIDPGSSEERRRTYEALSPEEKAWLKEKYRQWKSLPPEKRKALKRKMERWMRLSPEDRALFRRRFQQWKSLPPQERKILREKLKRWKELSPQEREAIRRRFLQGH